VVKHQYSPTGEGAFTDRPVNERVGLFSEISYHFNTLLLSVEPIEIKKTEENHPEATYNKTDCNLLNSSKISANIMFQRNHYLDKKVLRKNSPVGNLDVYAQSDEA